MNLTSNKMNLFTENRIRSISVGAVVAVFSDIMILPFVAGRLGSGVWVTTDFKIFALTTAGKVLDGEGKFPGNYVRENTYWGISHTY